MHALDRLQAAVSDYSYGSPYTTNVLRQDLRRALNLLNTLDQEPSLPSVHIMRPPMPAWYKEENVWEAALECYQVSQVIKSEKDKQGESE